VLGTVFFNVCNCVCMFLLAKASYAHADHVWYAVPATKAAVVV
jgi:hypothetical protein